MGKVDGPVGHWSGMGPACEPGGSHIQLPESFLQEVPALWELGFPGATHLSGRVWRDTPRARFPVYICPLLTLLHSPAEVTLAPALGLQGCVRDSPALPVGPLGTPTSFSSSSSTDGDLDFQSPEGSQGCPGGKGEQTRMWG